VSELTQYADGTHANSRITLERYGEYVRVLHTIDEAFRVMLPALRGMREGTALFMAMSHAAFLAAVRLAASGELPPAYMVFRGTLEDALYGFYLFHHPALKPVWMARHDSDAAKKKVRDEFRVGKMKKFLTDMQPAVGDQFGVVYDATIDFGAHPNALVFTSHLAPIEGSTDQMWQYIDLSPVDQGMALRLGAMAGLNSLNVFRLIFTDQFDSSGGTVLLLRAHQEMELIPEPGGSEEELSAERVGLP